ncbi:DUF294 nucleotidyltransferase-like domain-containing protein [Pseudoruegeria sp. SHC-113]|uniref:DUF294 nucleotidyltransferase-like domain-containing protein n=1 Tax=Pseudoruegeria sp. SHC-113 TaxID=2855439 RepID=UPI0021BA4BD9|nr:DUF294 nucleotidyltransferase-like domain-containing protein [Pseudoruegeria sp. SHC-113]MCT8161988.1 CBS domain-containing protein [Pseudoruegeria sp. SHC-113]
MPMRAPEIAAFLAGIHPYDTLPAADLERVSEASACKTVAAGETVYKQGDKLEGLYIVFSGEVDVEDANGVQLSHLGSRNSFGERGLLRDGKAVTTARAAGDAQLLLVPARVFLHLLKTQASFARFFDRSRATVAAPSDLSTIGIGDLMARDPLTCTPKTSVTEAARIMRDNRVSSLGVIGEGGQMVGILTIRDLAYKAVADGTPGSAPVSEVMRADPVTLDPGALGSDVLHAMLEMGVGHLPVVDRGCLIGMVTQTDLTRFQAISSSVLVADVAEARDAFDLAAVTARIPQMLVQLVGSGNPHQVVTRLITDVGDAVTRRLLALAEEKLGPAPVPYLWLACGSQGRREQTGVSDQDNCLILDDAFTEADRTYFTAFAKFVSDGLDAAGYYYCPGDMMATNPQWCQPLATWTRYFQNWIAKPDPKAQMLASVMFDLRPIGGTAALFDTLQADTLKAAAGNSIFVAHMVSNSLKHTPPLGLLRGFATIRSGEHKNTLDLKHNGVVPVVDLGRVYALQGQLTAANTRERLLSAGEAGVLSKTGARDLVDAYDLIAQTRLEHQAGQIKAGGKPDNFLPPAALSDFERSHLRDAFVVIRTMQSSIGHGRSMLG